MRIIVFGTGPFAVPLFQDLISTEHHLLLLVTRPIDDPGQRRKVAANPMRDLAVARDIPIAAPPDANELAFVEELRRYQADLFVVCDFGQILSPDCLAAARCGGINLHGALLPKYRGSAPVQWAIYRGEAETGVSVIHMTGQLDGGPILSQYATLIAPGETGEQLETRLAQLGSEAVHHAIGQIQNWDGRIPLGSSQNPTLVTRARRLRKNDGLIRWSRSARQIANQIRAFQPWPGSFTEWPRPDGSRLRWIIWQAAESTEFAGLKALPPGQIYTDNREHLLVHTGSGLLELQRIQLAGKKPLAIGDFLRGSPVKTGDLLQ